MGGIDLAGSLRGCRGRWGKGREGEDEGVECLGGRRVR